MILRNDFVINDNLIRYNDGYIGISDNIPKMTDKYYYFNGKVLIKTKEIDFPVDSKSIIFATKNLQLEDIPILNFNNKNLLYSSDVIRNICTNLTNYSIDEIFEIICPEINYVELEKEYLTLNNVWIINCPVEKRQYNVSRFVLNGNCILTKLIK